MAWERAAAHAGARDVLLAFFSALGSEAYIEATGSGGYRFQVRFYTDTGELWSAGPCCGETESHVEPVSRFTYTVHRVGERYLVSGLPPYVP